MSYPPEGPGSGDTVVVVVPPGGTVKKLGTGTLTTSKKLVNAKGYVTGWSARETTGSAGAVVQLFDGVDSSGTKFAEQGLPNGTGTPVPLGDIGLYMEQGVFVNVLTGSVDVVVWFRYA